MEVDGAELGPLLAPGGADALSVLVDPTALVVHGAPADRAGLRTVPTVTVLVGHPEADDPAGFDICLTPAADPPRPWVTGEVDAVAATVKAHPLAALALVTLLRTPPPDTWTGLAFESAVYATLLGGDDFKRWLAGRGPARPVAEPRPAVHVERIGDRLVLTLDRPGVHNAVNTAMRDLLVEALQLASTDPSITAVDLGGAGPSFSSGGDLDEFGTAGDPPTAHAVRLTRHPGWWMDRCATRVTAHLHGACIGAGIELPAFAAHVVAADDTVVGLPEVSMGLVPGAGGSVSLPRRIGPERTAWLALSGDRIDAATALAWGLVDSIDVE